MIGLPTSSALALDVESLVQSRLSKDGKTLDLTRQRIRTAGAQQLAGMEVLKGVTTLLLEGNLIKKDRMEAIRATTVSSFVDSPVVSRMTKSKVMKISLVPATQKTRYRMN